MIIPIWRKLRVFVVHVSLVVICWPAILFGQQTDIRGDSVNSFPVTRNGEGFHNEATAARVSFKVYFPVDESRYLPVSQALAKHLSEAPVVKASPHMKVQVTRTICTPLTLNLTNAGSVISVTGAVVECDIEFRPEPLLEQGSHEIELEFTNLTELYREVDAEPESVRAVAKIFVSVWPSREAKIEAEEKSEKEKREREEATAKELREFRLWLLQLLAIALAATFLPALVTFRYRKWIIPTLTLKVTPGQHLQVARAVKALRGEEFAEPGTILRTLWAKDWHGKTMRVKVETFVAGDGDAEKTHQNHKVVATTHHEFGNSGNPGMPGVENLRLDILVSVGASVPCGTYLADCPNGSVKIKVRKRNP